MLDMLWMIAGTYALTDCFCPPILLQCYIWFLKLLYFQHAVKICDKILENHLYGPCEIIRTFMFTELLLRAEHTRFFL